MANCVFCGIVNGIEPGDILYQDEEVMAFPDIQPRAPKHLLIIPKKLIRNVAATTEEDTETLGHLVQIARQVTAKLNVEGGFRLVINTGPDGGEAVPHLHVHLLAGRRLTWPPG